MDASTEEEQRKIRSQKAFSVEVVLALMCSDPPPSQAVGRIASPDPGPSVSHACTHHSPSADSKSSERPQK
ncbi:hypothetical protein BS17DRAFT_787460 [Gyrodon lividus]|nr:hypothetical protein BS17DRAFT_787460 [Gyrodon lividus]